MFSLLRIAGLLVEDAFRWVLLLFRSAEALQTENLFLRRQLALYIERDVQPRRIDAATRVSLALLASLFDWRGALVVAQPATMIRWHRACWRLLWRMKSRPGRPAIPIELRELIRRMSRENVLWGEERIANELLLKLGIRVSPRTVRKYLPKRPPGRSRGDLRWSTFLKSHARGILACDFFVAVTATFRMLYVFVVIEHGTRRLADVNVTTHRSATWTPQQLREVIADADQHKYLIHDRDSIFARHLDDFDPGVGPQGPTLTVLEPQGERDLRTGYRHYPARVSGLDDSDVGGASPLDPSRVGCSLQRWSSAQRTGSRCTRPSGRICTNLEG